MSLFTITVGELTLTTDASSASTNIKKWADKRYNHSGDNWEISLCDKWHQQLDEDPGFLLSLINDPLFLLILMESTNF